MTQHTKITGPRLFALLLLTVIISYFIILLEPHKLFCYTLSPSQGGRLEFECGGTYMIVYFISLFISAIIISTLIHLLKSKK